jgi:predicted SAM-dependent methyltransferase
MLNRNIKIAYYLLAGPFMRMNGFLYKFLLGAKARDSKVHLGPGQRNYINGWINIDANMFTAKCDLWFDLQYRLPFMDNTITCFYSHHMVEHLPNIDSHFTDVFRCLKNGGVYRVGGPNGHIAILKYMENDTDWFGEFPMRRESIGGMLDNFLLCKGEHVNILTYSFIEELMLKAGFCEIKLCKPSLTYHPALFQDCFLFEGHEIGDDCHTIIVEGKKISENE